MVKKQYVNKLKNYVVERMNWRWNVNPNEN